MTHPVFCTNCGSKLGSDALFCHICGTAIYKPEEPTPASEPVAISEPVIAPEPVAIPEPVIIPEPVVIAKPTPAPKPVATPAQTSKAVPAEKKIVQKQNKQTSRSGKQSGLAALLCAFLCICLIASILIISVQSITTKENLEQTIENVILEIDLTDIPADELIVDADPDLSMAEWIAEEVERSYVVPIRVDDDDVQKFLEDSTICTFIAKEISETMDDISEGKRGSGITKGELERLLWQNKKEIEDLVGIPLTQTDVDAVLARADADGLLEMFRAKTLKSDMPVAYNAIHYGFSTGALIVLLVISLAMIVLLAKVNRWNILSTCGDIGMVLAVIGGILLLVTIFTTLLSGLFYSLVGTIIGTLIGSIVIDGLVTTGTICVLSIVLILANILGNKLINKINTKSKV